VSERAPLLFFYQGMRRSLERCRIRLPYHRRACDFHRPDVEGKSLSVPAITVAMPLTSMPGKAAAETLGSPPLSFGALMPPSATTADVPLSFFDDKDSVL
jgi:hypothetical protein